LWIDQELEVADLPFEIDCHALDESPDDAQELLSPHHGAVAVRARDRGRDRLVLTEGHLPGDQDLGGMPHAIREQVTQHGHRLT